MLPETYIREVASALTMEINRVLNGLHSIASGKDVKKFLSVIAGLWIFSVVGNWFNFLTLFYIALLLLHTLPVAYEKHEDKVDSLSEKAWIEIKKRYALFDAKVLSQIPKGPLREKKRD
ncbi:reticulon-like protein B1 [Euphorbia lathyris]